MKNKKKENLKEKIIKLYLNYKLRKIGRVEFKYGRLICNVDMKKIYKNSSNKDVFINLSSDSFKKVLSRLGYLGKITYLFSDATIYGNIKIAAYSSNLRFKDCNFSNNIDIMSADEVTFQGDINLRNYFSKNKVSLMGNPKKINFANAKVTGFPFVFTNLFFETDLISIMDSEINLDSSACVNLVGKELSIINSKVNTGELSLKLENLVCDNSEIEVSKVAKVNVDEAIELDVINSKKLIVNGYEFISIEDVIEGDKAKSKLLKTLKDFSIECKKMGIPETEKVEKANQMLKKM